MPLRIGTLNLCLGLMQKKDLVLNDLVTNKIDICCLQETELLKDFPTESLNGSSFIFESEKNSLKSRVGVYINKDIEYERREDLEVNNIHVIIMDIKTDPPLRIFNIYRSFNPQMGWSTMQLFKAQLNLIKANITRNSLILGDFNLNAQMQFRWDYPHRLLYEELNSLIDETDIFQVVNFDTWQRIVLGRPKSSIIDHIYVTKDIANYECTSYKPIYGDHHLVIISTTFKCPEKQITFKRNWRDYRIENLREKLTNCNLDFDISSVQEYWNRLENSLVQIADELAPITVYCNNSIAGKSKKKPHINRMLNRRKKLLKREKNLRTQVINEEIKALNLKIRQFFTQNKRNFICSKIKTGDSKSLWHAVKAAKDIPVINMPKSMTLNDLQIPERDLPNTFADFFKNKITRLVESAQINSTVYNGKNKLLVINRPFMESNDIKECMLTLKQKNCEGFDRIPLRIITDAQDLLLPTFTNLFRMIYQTNEIPEQWKVSKIIPIFKKGAKNAIENYRPISNLCSVSKIFEKLILKQIHYLESTNNLDFTGRQQHGFKKKKSTLTAGILLQSLIARAADNNNYVLMASLDLSAAFDIVNVDLLIKRLRIIGIPSDVTKLIENWLKGRFFYVDIDGKQSTLHESDVGTIQGSILGPILYAIYVSPLFDLEQLTNFADDNFVLGWNNCISALIVDMEKKLEAITKWLKDSGLVVNEAKTEICLFHRNDQLPIEITINGTKIRSKKSMNVLGVIFDSKLNWGEHISNVIKKSKRSLQAIKIIKKYLPNSALLTLLKSNFYPILYYNSEIWLSQNLSKVHMNYLLAASAIALKICEPKQPVADFSNVLSYVNLHKKLMYPTPRELILYNTSLILYKLFNSLEHGSEWNHLNNQIKSNRRQQYFEITKLNTYKIGNNILVNRLSILNKKIKLSELNFSYDHFKFYCKQIFYSFT